MFDESGLSVSMATLSSPTPTPMVVGMSVYEREKGYDEQPGIKGLI